MLDGSLLPINSSIKNFKQEKTGYVANAVEQTLQLPDDMTDLRTMKIQGVSKSKERPRYGKFFKLSLLFIYLFIIVILLLFYYLLFYIYIYIYLSSLLSFLCRLSKSLSELRSW